MLLIGNIRYLLINSEVFASEFFCFYSLKITPI
nr:MAG TPA: hypothetical protein [Bacteriophage sp.]